jgi:hypothetical protein
MELGHLLSGWMRVALVRWGLATAEVASIAVRANAVITVFDGMTHGTSRGSVTVGGTREC